MRKLVVVAMLLVCSGRARACPDGAWIPDWVGYGFLAGIAGGYAYGTGYFIDADLSGDRRGSEYAGGELAFNGLAGTITALGTVESIKARSAAALPLMGLTALHGALAVHALENIQLDLHNFNGTAAVWGIGTVYTLETLVFVEQTGEHHGRSYGLAEVGIQAPIAGALGYEAYKRGGMSSIAFGAMAVVSGALAVHGIATAVSPYEPPALDLGITPTIVDDGHDTGLGLGFGRRW